MPTISPNGGWFSVIGDNWEYLFYMKVLIVEDSDLMRHALLQTLSNTGHVIRCAKDGEEAVQLLREEFFDVVITDYRMPRMGGLELTASLRELFGDGIRIIGMSASDDCRAKFIDAGVDAFLEKPIDGRRLAGLIETVVGVSSCLNATAR